MAKHLASLTFAVYKGGPICDLAAKFGPCAKLVQGLIDSKKIELRVLRGLAAIPSQRKKYWYNFMMIAWDAVIAESPPMPRGPDDAWRDIVGLISPLQAFGTSVP